jgi:acetyltransferase-like isoleucine patch superfamily enzyme
MSAPRDHLLNRARNLLYFGVRYPWVRRGSNVHVQWSARMWSPRRHIVIGNNVGIGPGCTFQTDVEIGNNVLIGGAVALIGSDDHRFDVAGKTMWESGRGDTKMVVVEDDVWIGYGSILLSGARIGRGSIIGAGSVIVGDIEPYSIMVPTKAHCLRKRFNPSEIVEHESVVASAFRRDR